jgi:hypothetical protein
VKTVAANQKLIAFCGLYCGACRQYLQEKCPGCRDNVKAAWCQIRKCGLENHYASCADCGQFSQVIDCKKYNNFMARVFGFVFRSNRAGCIDLIKKQGYAGFAQYMAENKLQTIKRP